MTSKCKTVRETLGKLKINPGGRGSTEPICPGLMVSLIETLDGTYQISMVFGARRKSIDLTPEDLVSKGKSKWRRDNLWRLSPNTIDRFEPGIAEIVARLNGVKR